MKAGKFTSKDTGANALLQRLKAKYLGLPRVVKQGGGTSEGYRLHIREWVLANREEADRIANLALENLIPHVWHATLPRSDEQLVLQMGGDELPEELVYPDIKAPGGHRHVLTSSGATVGHFWRATELKQRKANESTAAAQRDWETLDVMRERSRGRDDMLIKDIADGVSEEKDAS